MKVPIIEPVIKQEYLNIKIDHETKEQLRVLAELDNRTVTSYVKNFIRCEYNKKVRDK